MQKRYLKCLLAICMSLVIFMGNVISIPQVRAADIDGENLVVNGNFDEGTKGWEFKYGEIANNNPPEGSKNHFSLKQNEGAYVKQAITIPEDGEYNASAWIASEGKNGKFGIRIKGEGKYIQEKDLPSVDTEYHKYTLDNLTLKKGTEVEIYVNGTVPDKESWAWVNGGNFELRGTQISINRLKELIIDVENLSKEEYTEESWIASGIDNALADAKKITEADSPETVATTFFALKDAMGLLEKLPPVVLPAFDIFSISLPENQNLTGDGIVHKDDIYVTVPEGTNVTALVAEFTLDQEAVVTVGDVVQESGVTANDFTEPVVYTVTNEKGAHDYTVHVGDWRDIPSVFMEEAAGGLENVKKMERPSMVDYTQTIAMKLFMASPKSGSDTETESNVRIHFDEALDLIKEIDQVTMGMPKIIYLVGWQYLGHDDKYPAWGEVNQYLKCASGCDHETALDCLKWLMDEAYEKYNTKVSLHINSSDAYTDSPLWDEYLEKGYIAKDANGAPLEIGFWGGAKSYQIDYKAEWDGGAYKKRVDDLIDMFDGRLQRAGSIMSDAFYCREFYRKYNNDTERIHEAQEGRVQMVRYWRDCGIDLTTETLEDATGNIYGGEGGGMIGTIPMIWWFNQSLQSYIDRPATLIGGGEVCTTWSDMPMYRDRDKVEILFGNNLHGEEYFTADGTVGVCQNWETGFKKAFCTTMLPYSYLSLYDRLELVNDSKVIYSDGVVTDYDTRTITRDGKLLRDDYDIFIPTTWRDDTVIAYSKNGYESREWEFQKEWEADSVDVYNITKKGLIKLDSNCEIKDGKIKLTLEENQAVAIVPAGSDIEYIPGEFSLMGPQNGGNVLLDSDAEFTWEKSKDAGNYKVVVAKDAHLKDVVCEGNTTDTKMPLSTFKDKLETDSKYYWKVFATVDQDNFVGLWSSGDAFSFYTDITKVPETPRDFNVSTAASNRAKLTWTDPSDGASEYEIYRKEKVELGAEYQLLDTVKGTEYIDESDFDSTILYEYKLVAKNIIGTAEPVYAQNIQQKWLEFEEADSYAPLIRFEENDGGTTTSFTRNGAWFLYEDVDFGDAAPKKITVRYAANNTCARDGKVEIHLDGKEGELLATVDVPPTGGWDSFVTVETNIDKESGEKLKGVHTICLVLKGSAANFGKFNWISFGEERESADVDKNGLQNLYDSIKDLQKEGYTKETWDVFVTARDNAKAVLDNMEATQEEVNTAAEQLQGAVDGLRVSKTTLKYYLDEAKKHVENGDVDNSAESIQKLFDEAIKEGEAVMEKENATKEEVQDATVKLIKAIQALDMKPGDKTDLEMTVELADMLDLNKYVAEGQQEFKDALTVAKDVLNDKDAMQEDIDTAWKALAEAMSNLRLKANKEALKDLLEEVEKLDLSKYTDDSVAVFEKALAYANEVMADETLSEDDQKKVDEATKKLKEAKDALVVKSETGDNTPIQNPGQNTDTGKDSGKENAHAVKTGDTAPIGVVMGIVGVSALVVLAAGMMRKKRR